ncbi:hypothetical protein STEG23_023347 [Scotinomys teguina]
MCHPSWFLDPGYCMQTEQSSPENTAGLHFTSPIPYNPFTLSVLSNKKRAYCSHCEESYGSERPNVFSKDCSLKIREPEVPAPWFLDPGGWSKTATVSLYFIFPGICTLSLNPNITMQISVILSLQEWDANGITCCASFGEELFQLYQSLTQVVGIISPLLTGREPDQDENLCSESLLLPLSKTPVDLLRVLLFAFDLIILAVDAVWD